MSNEEKDYLYDAVADLISRYGERQVLDDICVMLSENALHEVIAAVSAFREYPTGITFWYHDRADYVDREFWESDIAYN